MDKLAIKIILIVLILTGLRLFIVHHSMQLMKRLFAIFLFLILLTLIIFPEISTYIANKVGIGRGADLTFYISHLFLLLLVIILWRRMKTQEAKITKLAQNMAIENAKKPTDCNP